MTQSPFDVLGRLHRQFEAQLEDLAHTYSPEALARMRTILRLYKELCDKQGSSRPTTELIDELRRLREEHDADVGDGTVR